MYGTGNDRMVNRMRGLRFLAVVGVIPVVLAGCGSSGRPDSSTIAAKSTDISFVIDGTTTYGTLQIPAHHSGQHLAGALLLAGSGPTDRDGNQPPSDTPGTLRQIAQALAQQGIMSLRFDKYFSGKTGAGAFASDPSKADLNASLRQADAAYAFLAKQSVADRSKLLVIGHSEGGMYALEVAGAVTPKPAGLALVEPQDEPILNLLRLQIDEQLDAAVSQGQITAAVARTNGTGIAQAIAAFRANQPVDLSGLLPDIVTTLQALLTSSNATYTRTADAVDPPTLAAKLPAGTRVLVTDGTADANIPPSTIGPLIAALTTADTTGPGLVTLDGLDHNLNPAGTPPNGAPLAPAFLSALKNWASQYASTPS